MNPHQFLNRRVGFALWGNQTIGNKVCVMWCVTELAAISETFNAIFCDLANAVIFPFPNEPTLKYPMFIEGLPVIR